jgi:hypothetical protein
MRNYIISKIKLKMQTNLRSHNGFNFVAGQVTENQSLLFIVKIIL